MKHEKLLSGLIGAVLSFGIAISGIGCMVTAFDLTSADMTALGWSCAACAVLMSVCFSFRRGGTVLLAAGALLLGFLLREGTLELELEAMLNEITRYYDSGYGWGYIAWSGADLTDVPVTGGLILVAVLVILVVSRAVCRRKSEVPAVIVGFLPLAACLVVTDTIPEEIWLFLLLTCLAVLLLTHPVRRKHSADGIRLTAVILVPALLAAMLLFGMLPQETYGAQMNTLQQTLISWYYQLPFIPKTGITVEGLSLDWVDLTSVGSKVQMQYAVMDVVSEQTQTLYLRGQSFDTYDGRSWTASEHSTGEDPYWPAYGLSDVGNVRISVRTDQPQIFFPYYITESGLEYDFIKGMLENTEDKLEYSFYQKKAVPGVSTIYANADMSSGLLQQCLELPQETRRRAEAILNELPIQEAQTNTEKAAWIQQYVVNSAAYDLKTSAMPADQTDFALWFLEESNTGYCVHFASAAVVLLRAAGVPARYVSGYMVNVYEGVRKTVTAERAHAWVEYLDPEMGWTVLEVTPGEAMIEAVQTEPSETTEPTQTEPSETTEPTQTEPSETTEPTQTRPIDITRPTQSTQFSEATDPTQTQPVGGTAPEKIVWPEWLVRTLWVILWILAAIAVIAGQYWIRIRLWQKRMYTGSPNQQALERWRYARRMKRITGKKLPKILEELSEKAVFSQHTLTKEELQEYDVWLQEARKALQAQPWYQRMAYKLIFAVR